MDDDKVRNFIIESLTYTHSQNNDGYFTYSNKAKHPYPCGICQKNVNNNQKAIMCSSCEHWIHTRCNGTSNIEYEEMMNINSFRTDAEIDGLTWNCIRCELLSRAQILPFGFVDDLKLPELNSTDKPTNSQNNLTFEISSKIQSIGTLKNADRDENIISNIDSRYYSCHEYHSLEINKAFNIIHSNVNGLEHKLDDFSDFVNNAHFDLDVLCVSETSQRKNQNFKTNITIDGFNQPYSLGSKSARGGVAIYINNKLDAIERHDLNSVNSSYEAIWVEIKQKSRNIICACVYRHPNSNDSDFTNYISNCLKKINKEKKESYIAGDFNYDLLKYDTNARNSDFLNIMSSFGFLPSILQPTRITEFTSTLIDNIYSNNVDQASRSGNILISFADHFTHFISINKFINKNKPKVIFQRNYENFDPNLFIDDVSIQNWNFLNCHDTGSKFNDFVWRLEGCV